MRVSYIGEAVTATGFALAGVTTQTPPVEADAVWAALALARAQSDLVVLNEAHARCLGERLLPLLREHPVPPILLLPGMEREEQPAAEFMRAARRALGLPEAAGRRDGA